MWVFAKYWLLQITGFAVVAALLYAAWRYLEFPAWAALGVLALWVAKDAVLFPFLRAAYGPHERGGVHDLTGARGVAVDRLAPDGYVRVGAELWRAELRGGVAVDAGQAVRVRAVRGLTLEIEPDE